MAEDLSPLPRCLRYPQFELAQRVSQPRRLADCDLRPFRPQPARQRWIARQVDAFLHTHNRGKLDLEYLLPAAIVTAGAHDAVAELEPLNARDAWRPQCMRDAHGDLVATRISCFIAKEHERERGRFHLAHRLCDRGRGGDWAPLAAICLQQYAAVRTQREHLSKLVCRLGWSKGKDRDCAALLLTDPNRFLDCALLVRTHREAGKPGVDFAGIRQHDLAADRWHAFDADEYVHCLAPDSLIGRVEQRRGTNYGNSHGILLAQVLNVECCTHHGLFWRQVSEQEMLAN